jgi:hypothetical protein
VTGDTAESIDESDTMTHWLPIVVALLANGLGNYGLKGNRP